MLEVPELIMPSPTTGIYMLAHEVMRQLPMNINDVTQETIHPSVFAQSNTVSIPKDAIAKQPQLIGALLPLEQQLKDRWPYDPNGPAAAVYAAKAVEHHHQDPDVLAKVEKLGVVLVHRVLEKASHVEAMRSQSGQAVYEKNHLTKLLDESHLGPYLKAFEKNLRH
jgi:hypothetical protein